jgi:lysophospholipase L1-like esterase
MNTILSRFLLLTFLSCISCFSSLVHADSISSNFKNNPGTFILEDINEDGKIELLAFGDSITRGVGDFFEPGEFIPFVDFFPMGEAGYPLRIELWLNLPVENRGRPGERINNGGVFRFAPTVAASSSDYVVISEGANDAFSAYSDTNLSRDLQALINMTQALGKKPILMTIPPPCCNRAGLRPFVENYNIRYRDIATINRIPLADTERAFKALCPNARCSLLNLPEGLHPNTRGYDVMGEMFASLFYGIDLFSPGGSSLLAQALGIPESQIILQSPPPATPTTPVTDSERQHQIKLSTSMYDPMEFPFGYQ